MISPRTVSVWIGLCLCVLVAVAMMDMAGTPVLTLEHSDVEFWTLLLAAGTGGLSLLASARTLKSDAHILHGLHHGSVRDSDFRTFQAGRSTLTATLNCLAEQKALPPHLAPALLQASDAGFQRHLLLPHLMMRVTLLGGVGFSFYRLAFAENFSPDLLLATLSPSVWGVLLSLLLATQITLLRAAFAHHLSHLSGWILHPDTPVDTGGKSQQTTMAPPSLAEEKEPPARPRRATKQEPSLD